MELTGLTTKHLGRPFFSLQEVDSTNTFLKDRAWELPHGAAVVAEHQTAGKGRRGRSWQDQPGETLALSVLLKEACQDIALLPLQVGLAACEAIRALYGAPAAIKWPNDLILGGKKLSGILCESCYQDQTWAAVAGIGINLNQEQESFDQAGLIYATSLKLQLGRPLKSLQLAAELLNQLEHYYSMPFEEMLPLYRQRCITLGRQVRVLYGGEQLEGEALTVDHAGNLICRIGGQERAIRSGEASVRGLYGYI